MIRSILRFLLLSFSICLAVSPSAAYAQNERPIPGIKAFRRACDSIERYMNRRSWNEFPLYVKTAYVANRKSKNATLVIVACRDMAYYPFREGDVEHIHAIMKDMMPEKYKAYRNRFRIEANKRNLKAYTPGYYSTKEGQLYVKEHKEKVLSRRTGLKPLVRNVSNPSSSHCALTSKHLALWQSHGYYYERSMDRWEWMRGRIFGTVEDKYTQSYVVPFLVPMLENAGAVVMTPRERDTNPMEVIVDNDIPDSGYIENGKWSNAPGKGFSHCAGRIYKQGENPFLEGSARQIRSGRENREAFAKWIPDIPSDGEYSVYISYRTLPTSAEDADYKVHHSGGTTSFKVNQKMSGSTWVYLGKFFFKKGRHDNQGVTLSSFSSQPNSTITSDGVRFGGGMGNIARGKSSESLRVSSHPRFNEASTYYLQWSGFADTIYSATKFENDYKDDIKCKSLWVNTLISDYHVPVDLSLAFHSDAGLRSGDSIVGTLAIHTWKYENKFRYPNGERRFLARDMADIVQTQVVSDIRSLFDSTWTRRGLCDRSYGECNATHVPSMILELLSHQNFNDMKYGLDPKFRFTVSRAVYKGILRYLAWLNDEQYIVQPLPVKGFSVDVQSNGGNDYAHLKWSERRDILEPTAEAERFIVYRKCGDGGFDNGTVVEGNSATIPIERGILYSFKVVAANDGGLSFPSETLCAFLPAKENDNLKKVIVVNNFTRISAPDSFMSADSLTAGFLYDRDAGVPYIQDICYCGKQYEFRRDAAWESDDYPGFGASQSDYDSQTMAGNTFDFVKIHSEALSRMGYSIISSSIEAVDSLKINLNRCDLVDIICGKEKKPFSPTLQKKLTEYATKGHRLIVSGSYIARDTASAAFLDNVLGVRHAAFKGPNNGIVQKTGTSPEAYSFHTSPNPQRYHIEKPDGVEPSGRRCKSILRYDNGITAGVLYNSSDFAAITLGFPIETLYEEGAVDDLMQYLCNLL